MYIYVQFISIFHTFYILPESHVTCISFDAFPTRMCKVGSCTSLIQRQPYIGLQLQTLCTLHAGSNSRNNMHILGKYINKHSCKYVYVCQEGVSGLTQASCRRSIASYSCQRSFLSSGSQSGARGFSCVGLGWKGSSPVSCMRTSPSQPCPASYTSHTKHQMHQ